MRAVALVVTLALLTLVTVIIVAFVSVTAGDLTATKSYVQSLQAEQIAMGGLNSLTTRLQSEVTDPGKSTAVTNSGYVVYFPTNAASALPQRMLTGLATNLISIAKISTNGVPLFTPAASNAAAATNAASGLSTLTPSLNGRSISVARWNAPLLTTGTNGFPVPDWVLVTRSGPKVFAPGTNPSQSGLDAGIKNPDSVIGRYAYVVYDVGGLLDINAAGYPSVASASSSLKGLLPWADLTQLSPRITSQDIDALVMWRNAVSAASATSFTANVTNAAAAGFLRTSKGDTAFLGRQELIQYAQTKNRDLTNALPFLTTFSRELDAPCWGPTTNLGSYAYLTARDNASSVNRLFPNVRVRGKGFLRRDGTMAVVGEPLLKTRFPLDKLALLEKTVGPPNALSASDKSAILSYFGLVPDPLSNGYYRKWIYTNPSGGTPPGTLMTLDQVASARREPDFFELLQAGILSGSLGAKGRNDDAVPVVSGANLTVTDYDPNTYYQIIRIGANIIDQWHADNYPTTITFNGNDFYGIADLPYINQLFLKTASDSKTYVKAWCYPQLWNPHQAPATASSASPSSFRISFSPQDVFCLQLVQTPNTSINRSYWYWKAAVGAGSWAAGGHLPLTYFNNSSSTDASYGDITFSGVASSSYREPGFVSSSFSPSVNVTGLASSVGGWNLGTLTLPPPSAPNTTNSAGSPAAWNSATTFQIKISLTSILRLQFLDPNTPAGPSAVYHTYATFVGIDNGSSPTSGFSTGCFITPYSDFSLNGTAFLKSDPRTSRFSAGVNASYATTIQAGNASLGLLSSGVVCDVVTPTPTFTSGTYRPDVLSINDNNVTMAGSPSASTQYADPDGVVRFGDVHDAYAAHASAPSGSSSPFYSTGTSATAGTLARPVILHRPFRSVAEMGFAFRDMPWKTLDFFSQNSADAGLLDLFTLSDAQYGAAGLPMVAGRVSPNTPYTQVLAAELAGALLNPFTPSGTVSSSAASSAAQAIVAATKSQPVMSRSELVSRLTALSAVSAVSATGLKSEQEAVARSLGESSNTRTWNFLIDLIGQSGRYPPTATRLDQFMVEGERRYWLHIAIDRYTGKIVDQQLEVVSQ